VMRVTHDSRHAGHAPTRTWRKKSEKKRLTLIAPYVRPSGDSVLDAIARLG
jgi:hypothetical protein